MKKLIVSCVLMFAVVMSAVFSIDIGTALDQAAEQFSASLPTGTTVAIVGIASDTDSMTEWLLNELTFCFVQQRRLTVANRANLDAIKQEMNFQLSGEVSDASIQEIGAMAGAETVIHGSLKQMGSMYILSLQALNVTTATVEDMYRETIDPDEITNLLLEGKGNANISSKKTIKTKLDDKTKKITVGLRGNVSINAGSTLEGDPSYIDMLENEVLVGGGAALYGKYNFTPLIGLQTELSILGINGCKYSFSNYNGSGVITYSYTSFDIPLLLTFDVLRRERIGLTLFAGPYVSFPISQLKFSGIVYGESGSESAKIESVALVGMTGGVSTAFSVGIGAIVADIRYNLDFMPISVESTDIFTRRFLAISVGYQLKF